MAYERLNLPKGTVLKEHHIAHIENGIVNLEARASEIESVAVRQSYDTGYEQGYSFGYSTGEQIGHQEGVAEGWEQGNAEGWANGSQEQYNAFWDAFQTNHNNKTRRTNYEYAFAGQGWNNDILKPKYDMTPSTATGMFLSTQYNGDLRDLPVSLDFSNCTAFGNLCAYSYNLTGVGKIDTRKADSITAMFTNCTALVTIQKLILKADGSQTYGTNPFNRCDKLENIEVEGAFGQNTNFQHSTKLSKASIISIIKALYSGASGKTLTLSTTAVNAIDWSGTVIDGVTYNTFDEIATSAKPDGWKISLL